MSAHPDFLFRKLNLRQIAGWLAYHRISPIGRDRVEAMTAHQTGLLVAAILEAADKQLNRDVPGDAFLYKPGKPPEPTEEDQIVSEILGLMK